MAQGPPKRINRAIDLLEMDQALYYDGPHTGHVLTYEQGRKDARTWADYINVGMEHGAFDMTGLEAYMRGLVDGGPTNSGHRAPTVIVEAPVNGIDGQNVAFNAWQFRQILARGAHGILLCQAESADAVREFVRACRFPHHKAGTDKVGTGSRGRGSEPTAAPIWGIDQLEYFERCEPWPLSPKGELLLGVKIESPPGVNHCEEILAVPGLGFAELGPGDLGLSLGYTTLQRRPYPPEMEAARAKVLAACKKNKLAYLEGQRPDTIAAALDEGVRIIAGHNLEVAKLGRTHQKRTMPV
jgi:4-hydroxy-2-oxoheptanedioate aldolase